MTKNELWIMGAVGLFGALIGHLMGYWVAHPHAHERHEVLVASGHGYFDMAVAVALVGALVALAGQFALGFLEDRSGSSVRPSRAAVLVTLVGIQIGAFLSVELLERIVAGASPLDAFHEAGLWWALPVQVVIAGVGMFLLHFVRRVGAAAARALAIAASSHQIVFCLAPCHEHVSGPAVFPVAPTRGPPSILTS